MGVSTNCMDVVEKFRCMMDTSLLATPCDALDNVILISSMVSLRSRIVERLQQVCY